MELETHGKHTHFRQSFGEGTNGLREVSVGGNGISTFSPEQNREDGIFL